MTATTTPFEHPPLPTGDLMALVDEAIACARCEDCNTNPSEAWADTERARSAVAAALAAREAVHVPADQRPPECRHELTEDVRQALDSIMDFRHTSDGMVRGGRYVKKDDVAQAMIDRLAAPQAPQAAQPRGSLDWKLVGDTIEQSLHHYRSSCWLDDADEPMPLADLLTPEGRSSVETGDLELEMLGDHIYNDLQAAFAQQPAAQAVEPIGWLVRGGGPLPIRADDHWQYCQGPDRPRLSWTHQEMKPVFAAAQQEPRS